MKPASEGPLNRHDRAKKERDSPNPASTFTKNRQIPVSIILSMEKQFTQPALNNPGVKNLCTLEFNLLLVVGRRAFEFSGRWRDSSEKLPPRPFVAVEKTAEAGVSPAKSSDGRDVAPSKVSERLKRKDHQWRRAFGSKSGERTAGGKRSVCDEAIYSGRWVRRRRRKGETRIRRACRERGRQASSIQGVDCDMKDTAAKRPPRTRGQWPTCARDTYDSDAEITGRDYFVDRARGLSRIMLRRATAY
ncbi:hypothetical protein QLX08_000414 [Tetragonisca angustula]|uniref:Uncharacterized protein n=1 Tax=Tetragonisca angustula TaxID=166442 RepID=A0AAW1AM42_9HYME